MKTSAYVLGSAITCLAITLSGCSGSGGSTPDRFIASSAKASPVNAPFSYSVHPKAKFVGVNLNFSNCVPTNTTDCATPTVLRTGYDFPSNETGAGKTIMIVDAFGSPTIAADVAKFSTDTGLPKPNLTILYPGGKPTFNPNQAADVRWAEETSLDVEWAHAAAPGAALVLIVAANDQGQSIQSAQQYAIQTVQGDVLSLSFGVQESSINGGANNTQLQQAHQIYQNAAAAGKITIIASTGDLGAVGGFGVPNAQFPASDPYVLGVGGTVLTLFHNNSYRNEGVWNDTTGASGGAPSLIFPTPAWQSAAIAAYNAATGATLATRTSGDVAYNASPDTGVAVYFGFASQVPGLGPNGYYAVGGTSQGPPQWAGIIAAADQALNRNLGCVNATFYALSTGTKNPPFHDVTSGNNSFPAGKTGYTARGGWDPPTGLGSPDVTNLISALSSTAYKTCQ